MRLGLILSALFLLATPALAQRELDTGTRFTRPRPAEIPDRASMSEAERGRFALAQFADCLVEKNRPKVTAVLNYSEPRGFSQLDMDECLRSGLMRFDGTLLRGALYAALYRRDYADSAPKLSEVPLNFSKDLPITAQDRLGLLIFADCLARRDLENARAFVLAAGGSNAENGAFAALRPFIGACVPQGQTVTLSKTVIEAGLSEVIYRQVVPALSVEKR